MVVIAMRLVLVGVVVVIGVPVAVHFQAVDNES